MIKINKNFLFYTFQPEEYIFTRVDTEHNTRVLSRSVNLGHTEKLQDDVIDETTSIMKNYNQIAVERWDHLVSRYLHRSRIKRISKSNLLFTHSYLSLIHI